MVEIKRIGVLSMAKIQALVMGVMGILLGLIYAIMGIFYGVTNNSFLIGFGLGVLAIILVPLMYGGFGFVCGAFGAFVYNLIAKWVGGIDIELKK